MWNEFVAIALSIILTYWMKTLCVHFKISSMYFLILTSKMWKSWFDINFTITGWIRSSKTGWFECHFLNPDVLNSDWKMVCHFPFSDSLNKKITSLFYLSFDLACFSGSRLICKSCDCHVISHMVQPSSIDEYRQQLDSMAKNNKKIRKNQITD